MSLANYYDESYPPSLWGGGGGGEPVAPVLASINPATVALAFVGLATLTGTGFVNPAQITIDGMPFDNATFVSSTTLTFNLTAANVGGIGPHTVAVAQENLSSNDVTLTITATVEEDATMSPEPDYPTPDPDAPDDPEVPEEPTPE